MKRAAAGFESQAIGAVAPENRPRGPRARRSRLSLLAAALLWAGSASHAGVAASAPAAPTPAAGSTSPSQAATTSPRAARPVGRAGTIVVPDRLLRSWDPVTVFFDKDRGPSGGGPEDDPSRFVRFAPSHPGAFTWLDARTLQFKPAEAWPALERFTWTVDGRTVTLSTLFVPPVGTEPSDRATGLAPVDAIKLVFATP